MEKINIAEILKDCPKGMELDCTIYDNIKLIGVDEICITSFPIRISRGDGCTISLTKYGQYVDADFGKCVIFPKGKTTWEGFQRPCKFKDGDILFVKSSYSWIFIYKESENKEDLYKYAAIRDVHNPDYLVYDNCPLCYIGNVSKIRLATEEEKEKLFNAIKANGYRWNAETKTLEKLELVHDKFNIHTLKPFDKVLIRDLNSQMWTVDMFSFYDENLVYPFNCIGHCSVQCIPYEGNEHLLGTTDDCDEYYKTWG